MEELLSSLEADAPARLRWLVLRRLGSEYRDASESEILLAAANMVLDAREDGGDATQNPGFDRRRFDDMKEGLI